MKRRKLDLRSFVPGYTDEWQRRRAALRTARPMTPEDYMWQEAERAHEERQAREDGREGAEYGHKGGRPSPKPARAHLRSFYQSYYLPTCDSPSQARAALVADAAAIYGTVPETVRRWLRDAGIG